MRASALGLNLTDSVYERLLSERIIFLGSQVDDDIANRICAQILLLAAEDATKDIHLYINSPGGSISAGMAIYDTMALAARDVATYGMGMAASMGQFLLAAGTKGKRYPLPRARILRHQPLGGVTGRPADVAITVYINSPGGSFTSLMAIYDTMQYVRADIQTVCLGQAASAAAVLLAAGTPGKRMALPNARVLIHQPSLSGVIQGQFSDLEIQAAEIERMRTLMETTLAHHTGKDAAVIRKDTDRDKILTAEEAKEYGIIDTVLEYRKLSAQTA